MALAPRRWQTAVLLLTLVACPGPKAEQGVAPASFVVRTARVDGVAYRYTVFVPARYTTRARWPVVLFLHGIGERGADNALPARYSLGAYLRTHGDAFGGVVVFPQAPADSYWTGQPARAALVALEQAVQEFHGDRQRLYLTGLSMGGYGSWELAMTHPHLFAAIAVVCGGVLPPRWDTRLRVHGIPANGADPYAFVASALRTVPAWVFHGDSDTTIPVEESRRMVAALRAVGDSVRYTEYPGVGHNAWDRAYADGDLWHWLFGMRRGGR